MKDVFTANPGTYIIPLSAIDNLLSKVTEEAAWAHYDDAKLKINVVSGSNGDRQVVGLRRFLRDQYAGAPSLEGKEILFMSEAVKARDNTLAHNEPMYEQAFARIVVTPRCIIAVVDPVVGLTTDPRGIENAFAAYARPT